MPATSSQAGTDSTPECACRARLDGSRLVVDAVDCPGRGHLATRPGCRETVVDALDSRSVSTVAIRLAGRERTYRDAGSDLLVAASAFAKGVADVDERLAARARREPLAAAREATGRAGPVADLGADTELAAFAASHRPYEALFRPSVGLAWSTWRIAPTPPPGSQLESVRDLDTGATVRRYAVPGRELQICHLEPPTREFDAGTTARLAAAYDRLVAAHSGPSGRTPRQAVRDVATDGDPVISMVRVLRTHTQGWGLLEHLFADSATSDVFVTAPAQKNPLRVRVDGETLETNVYLTGGGTAALASRFRRASGRGFSRAEPTLDAAITIADRRIRVAGVTDPVSDGQAFAFRAHDRHAWTLPALIGNGTLTPAAAGLLSVAVERGAAILLAGPRGSGKTTTLGALLWELPEPVRTVVIEDTPELPVATLQAAGRDVQALRAETDGPVAPAAALRSALRLGDGALVLGEVRGEEAAVLYEAMRVGASSEAVLGTIHGSGAEAVLERVVSDLGVPASAFAATDLVVTLETAGTGTRRVRSIEAVGSTDPIEFAPLFDRSDGGLSPTGRIDRGNSAVIAALTPPESTYAETRRAIDRRAEKLGDRAETGRAAPLDRGTAPTDREP